MITPQEIKKMVESVIRRDKGLQDRRIMHPARDWFIGLGLMFAIIIAGGVYSAVSYVTYDTIDYSQNDIDQALITYRTDNVEAAIEMYTLKKDAHRALMVNGPAAAQVTVPEIEEAPTADTSDTTTSSVPEEEETVSVGTPVLAN